MHLTKIFAKVSEVLTDRKKVRARSYQALVIQIADGGDPDADQMADVLEQAGKTADQLAADVDLVLKRRQWKSQLDRRPHWEKEYNRLTAAITAEDERFKKAMETLRGEHFAKMDDLRGGQQEVDRQRTLCEQARFHLEETSGRQREMSDLNRQAAVPLMEIQDGDLGREYRMAQADVDRARRELGRRPKPADDPISRSLQGKVVEQYAAGEQELNRAEAKLARIEAEVNRRKSEAAELQAKVESVRKEAMGVV